MNKQFATFTLFFSTLFYAQAQDGFIKFQRDSEYKEKTIKVFKGEIIPFTKTAKSDKINIIMGYDTIADIKKTSDNFTEVSSNTSYDSQKDDFVKVKQGGLIRIDVSSISTGSDTIKFISEKLEVTPIVKNTIFDLDASKIGKSFRLIISNSPTIFYSIDKLKQFVEPVQSSTNVDSEVDINNESQITESGLSWWHYVLIALGIAGLLGLGVWKYIQYQMKPYSNKVKFKGGSLTEFADQYGGLDKLSSLNKGIIPTKSEWNKLKNNDQAKSDKIKELKGKHIIIREENETTFGFQGDKNQPNIDQSHSESPKDTYVQPTNFGNNEFSGQLRQMENNLLSAIQRVGSNNNNSNEINRLRTEKAELESKFNGLNTSLNQLKADKSNLETNLQFANAEKSQIQAEISILKEKVITVDFLKSYSDSVFSYLKFCQQVSTDAYSCFNKISQQNPKQAFAAGHLLMKFQTSINSIPIGNWLQTVQDIKDTGATTNKQLIRSFSQIQNDGEKQKEFQRLLFTEVLTKYSSNILILAEAFKNLSRFQVPPELANDIQNTFGKHVTEIVSKAKAAGLEIKYVSLFKNFEEYLGQIESVDKERTLAYREVIGLQKNEIAEIDSYGVKNNFEDSKTYVILS